MMVSRLPTVTFTCSGVVTGVLLLRASHGDVSGAGNAVPALFSGTPVRGAGCWVGGGGAETATVGGGGDKAAGGGGLTADGVAAATLGGGGFGGEGLGGGGIRVDELGGGGAVEVTPEKARFLRQGETDQANGPQHTRS